MCFEIDKATDDHVLTLDVWVSESVSLILSRTVVMKHLLREPRSHSLWISQWFDATLDLYQPTTSSVPALYSQNKKINKYRIDFGKKAEIWLWSDGRERLCISQDKRLAEIDVKMSISSHNMGEYQGRPLAMSVQLNRRLCFKTLTGGSWPNIGSKFYIWAGKTQC